MIEVNRAPVLSLWAATVAERLGFTWEEAVTLGRAVAGQSALAKGKALGIIEPSPEAIHERRRAAPSEEAFQIHLLGRAIPAVHTKDGIRALEKGKATNAATAERYVAKAFGDHYPAVREAMRGLAERHAPSELNRIGFRLYEGFRPEVPAGAAGWGAKGRLDLAKLSSE